MTAYQVVYWTVYGTLLLSGFTAAVYFLFSYRPTRLRSDLARNARGWPTVVAALYALSLLSFVTALIDGSLRTPPWYRQAIAISFLVVIDATVFNLVRMWLRYRREKRRVAQSHNSAR